MADIAEIIPESAVDMQTEECKEIKKPCETVENKVVDEKGDGGLPMSEETAEPVKETNTETDTTEKAAEPTTETIATEVAADTTEETPAGGIKRKSEEDEESSEANDELKKVKTDNSEVMESNEPTSENKEEPTIVNGNSAPEVNGCHDVPDGTNGQTCEDIPPEIVTKSVEDIVNQVEDIAASS